jgi:hypothetical protein
MSSDVHGVEDSEGDIVSSYSMKPFIELECGDPRPEVENAGDPGGAVRPSY